MHVLSFCISIGWFPSNYVKVVESTTESSTAANGLTSPRAVIRDKDDNVGFEEGLAMQANEYVSNVRLKTVLDGLLCLC
jgi:hypothetical protein